MSLENQFLVFIESGRFTQVLLYLDYLPRHQVIHHIYTELDFEVYLSDARLKHKKTYLLYSSMILKYMYIPYTMLFVVLQTLYHLSYIMDISCFEHSEDPDQLDSENPL